MTRTDNTHDARRAQIRGSLRGELALLKFNDQELLEEIVDSFVGMRLVSLDLNDVVWPQLLLDACTETLQMLCVEVGSHWNCKSIFKEYEMTSVLTEPV